MAENPPAVGNSHVTIGRAAGPLTFPASGYLEQAMEEINFSARAHDRIRKVTRRLVDIADPESIRPDDILEAIQFRSLDRKLFA